MTLVVGTAGHIDHGKTALLRALTGIDADRLPEERRRGMTIDVGYAHLDLPDGRSIDFVDVPGHDRLVGNMLVGAGEIDAALVVVALDDGPRAQTLEHLELLDALRIARGVVALTKADLGPADDARRDEVAARVRDLLERTTLAGAPVVVTSAATGEGLDELRALLVSLADPRAAGGDARSRLAVDRVFGVRGRGTVVTGTLRGGPIASGATLRVEPGGGSVRVREVQVHGEPVPAASAGRAALNLVATDEAEVRRGAVLGTDPGVVASDRLLVVVHRPPVWPVVATRIAEWDAAAGSWPPLGTELRLHLGTEQAGAVLRRAGPSPVELADGSVVAELRLDRPIAAAVGDRFALRRPSPSATVGGGRVLDPRPPVGPSRRRVTRERLRGLAEAAMPGRAVAGARIGGLDVGEALLDLHGALALERWEAVGGDPAVALLGSLIVEPALRAELADAAVATVRSHREAEPTSAGVAIGSLRTAVALGLRRRATAAPPAASAAASALIAELVASGQLVQDGDRVREPGGSAGPPVALAAAMDRLEASIAIAAPPPFGDAVLAAGCPTEGVRALEASGRIVRLEPELAFATTTYRELAARALGLAAAAPLTPAAFRDATGTSRKFALAILEDLDRRGVLRRTPDGHVPGPRAGIPGVLP